MSGRNLLPEHTTTGRNLLADVAEEAGGMSALEASNLVNQGVTWGAGDEVASAGRAALDYMLPNSTYDFGEGANNEGQSLGDRYAMYHKDANESLTQSREDSPWLSAGLEIAGAIPTGIAGAGKIGATKLGQAATSANIPAWLKMAIGGGSGAGLYGFNTGSEGYRSEKALKEGAIGAVATPVGAKVIKGASGRLSDVAERIKQKLSETPSNRADEVIRQAISNEGLTVGEVKDLYKTLGDESTLMDTGENLRMLGRAVADESGVGKRALRETIETRQGGQQDRLMGQVYKETGMNPNTADDFVTAISRGREEQAAPLYKTAYAKGIEPTPELVAIIEGRPAVKAAMKQAETLAKNRGIPADADFSLLDRVHWAKMALDDQISKDIRQHGKVTNKAAGVIDAKNSLLKVVDDLNPEYGKARQIWHDASTLENSIENGRGLFKMTPTEIRKLTEGMTDSERVGFKAGAAEALQGRVDKIGETHDAGKRLLNTKEMRSKLRHIFDTDDEFDNFVNTAENEGAFTRTRNVVQGGSPTSQNIRGHSFLDEASEGQAFYQTDTIGKVMLAAKKLLGEEGVDPALIKELTSKIGNRNLSDAELSNILSQGEIGHMLAKRLGTPSPATTASALIPIISE